MAGDYIPDVGDVIWVNFDPQSGHEQSGHRPALVMSSASYNKAAGLALCCPITTKVKGYPFEVLASVEGVENAILSDQLKSIDWIARKAKLKSQVSGQVVAEVKAKLAALLAI